MSAAYVFPENMGPRITCKENSMAKTRAGESSLE